MRERYSLCHNGSGKSTQHVVLDLKGSGITYEVGDSIAVFPVNDPKVVEKTLTAMHASGDELVSDKNNPETIALTTYLTKNANLTDISRKLLTEVGKKQPDGRIDTLLEDKELLKDYQNTHEVWDFLQEFPQARFSPQELVDLLMPMLPRFYSIASSQLEVGEEVHLTVALLNYVAGGELRLGVCTHYLCNLVPLNEPVVPVYIQPHKGFTLPENDDTSIIMIGPGTGVAPFRAFMQERIKKGGKGKNWLFFGEWKMSENFFYGEYWRGLEKQGLLRLDTAFSRDQEYKVYVQHKMRAHGADLFKWLQEGAVLYVCGDAHRMAKDVDASLHEIVKDFGHMTEEEAKAWIKNLRNEKRYLKDVY